LVIRKGTVGQWIESHPFKGSKRARIGKRRRPYGDCRIDHPAQVAFIQNNIQDSCQIRLNADLRFGLAAPSRR